MAEDAISIQNDQFGETLKSLSDAVSKLTPLTSDIPEISCSADTMKQYRQRLTEVGTMLEQYKALLQKDYNAVQAVQNNMKQLDESLAKGLSG